jgi:GTP-binding protein Era
MLKSEAAAPAFHCGHVTIVGRPNVGKSSLLNCLLDQKLSITSRKPQTTRWHLLGIKTTENCQAVYIDTPGIQSEYNSPIHRYMNREAVGSLDNVDIAIFVLEAGKWTEEDTNVLRLLDGAGIPVIVVINKIDKLKSKTELLPFIGQLSELVKNCEIVPVSAKRGTNIEDLERTVYSLLPEGPPLYPDDQITTHSERFFAAEFIREKLIERLGDELPYRLTVTIEQFNDKTDIISIKGIIWVESKSQKAILVGKNGAVMKSVGEAARKDMEQLFQKKVYLRNLVKVKKNWTMNNESLEQLGYTGQ